MEEISLLDVVALKDIEASFSSPLDLPEQLEEDLPRPDPELMLVLLDSAAVLERMQATRAFCEISDPRAIPRLIELLRDDCTLVRVSAGYALGRNPHPNAVLPLIEQLMQDWNGYVRKGVVWALGTCHDPRALQPLISALKYDITTVRLWAASALGQLGDSRAIEPLTTALETDKAEAVRSNCAWALGKLLAKMSDGDRTSDRETYQDAIDALINALEDLDLSVVLDAKMALRKLDDQRAIKVLDRMDIEQGYCEL